MKLRLFAFLFIAALSFLPLGLDAQTFSDAEIEHTLENVDHAMPHIISVAPFIILLLMIATGPLFYAHFWHKYYPHVAVGLGITVVGYYCFGLHDTAHPIHSFFEYFSFISLLTVLFVASGGILIKVDKKGSPWVNIALLVFGAFIANIIGTTGASMLLIRPFMRLNKGRIKPYHIVFFIFMVSNVGGCLTPIGDPPLFLGFLKGVDFFWTVQHNLPYWAIGIGMLSVIFYFVDSRNKETSEENETYTGKIQLIGAKNIVFLAIGICAVFLDPNILNMPSWAYIDFHGDKFSYIREIIMLSTAFAAYKFADKTALKGNDFNFEPIREVAFLFIGIFATMMPALQLIASFAGTDAGQQLIGANSLYWLTGTLSGVLDNAPTYMNFLTAA
ncbi:MAG: sodium:proton antiporter, partial [Chitinophagales bacterium]